MKQLISALILLAALSTQSGFATSCGPYKVNECTQGEYKYSVWVGDTRLDNYCYRWDQVLSTLSQLVSVGSCTSEHNHCVPHASKDCAAHTDGYKYRAFINGYATGNYCETWEQALAEVRDLHNIGICP